MFIKYEAEVTSRVGGGERGVVDFGKLFTETNEQKFSLGATGNFAPVLTQEPGQTLRFAPVPFMAVL